MRAKLAFFLKVLLSILTLALIIFIFYNSAQNAEKSNESSGRIMNFLNGICTALSINYVFTQSVVRMLAHFCEFGLLGFLSSMTALCHFGVKAKSLIVSVITVFATAITDEVIQLFSDGRAFQVSDMLIDISGGLLSLVTVFLFALLIRTTQRRI